MRFSCQWKIAGTKFFRLASAKLWNRGGNAQNWEKNLRVIFEPDDGKILVQNDQRGADAAIMGKGCLPKGNKLDLFFKYNIKPYNYMALVFTDQWEKTHPQVHALAKMSIPELAVSKCWKDFAADVQESDNNPPATRYYYHYKQTVLSGMYDIHPPTFRMNLLEKSGGKVVLTNEQSAYYLSGYHTLLHELRPWYLYIQETLKAGHTLYNLFGHPMEFTGVINESMYKEAYSAIPQGTVGTCSNIAYTNLQLFIEVGWHNSIKPIGKLPEMVVYALDTWKDRRREWDLLNNTHDSYASQCPIDDGVECATVKKYFMNNEVYSPQRNEKFKIESESQMGYNLAPAKQAPKDADIEDPIIIKKYNLRGLKEVKV